ncbi:hypothetical protein [Trichormus variabilis]|uniref:hypothetical protein n=1 Tax=Anabaena variabilis TaxID=264691 RepID=UPI000F8D8F9C|nr:hypothetical protein [Trichormus variabilis]
MSKLQKCDGWGEESDRYNLRTYEKTLKLLLLRVLCVLCGSFFDYLCDRNKFFDKMSFLK